MLHRGDIPGFPAAPFSWDGAVGSLLRLQTPFWLEHDVAIYAFEKGKMRTETVLVGAEEDLDVLYQYSSLPE